MISNTNGRGELPTAPLGQNYWTFHELTDDDRKKCIKRTDLKSEPITSWDGQLNGDLLSLSALHMLTVRLMRVFQLGWRSRRLWQNCDTGMEISLRNCKHCFLRGMSNENEWKEKTIFFNSVHALDFASQEYGHSKILRIYIHVFY